MTVPADNGVCLASVLDGRDGRDVSGDAACLLTGEVAELQAPLFEVEQHAMRRAVDKRRREFCAGRTLARQGLRRLGVRDPGALPVRRDRVPRWPAGFTGSISHTDRFCACAVARDSVISAVGIDLETCGGVRQDLWSQLFTEAETTSLLARPAEMRSYYATVIFSAKEAFYKLQYALTSAWLDFTDASVSVGESGRFVVIPATGTPAANVVPRIQGHYCHPFPDTVLCQVWLAGNPVKTET